MSVFKRKEYVVALVMIVGLVSLFAAIPSSESSSTGSVGSSTLGEVRDVQAVTVPIPVRQEESVRQDIPLQDAPIRSPTVPQQRVQIAAVAGRSATTQDYFHYFSTLMEEHLGSELWMAVYDEDALGELARAAAAGTLGDDDTFVWHINKLRSPPVDPKPFSTPASMLRLLKRLVSVGIGRVHRDAELGKLYAHTSSSPAAFLVFRRSLIRVVESYVNYFFTILQLTVDASNAPVRDALSKAQQKMCEPLGTDIMTLIMTAVRHDTPAATIATQLELSATDLSLLAPSAMARVRSSRGDAFRAGNRVLAMFPIEYDAESYGGQRPVNGKFWNMIRPTASCSSLVRLCEKPDGCRLLCNAEYLLHAGLQSSQATVEYHHRMAGFGSNNEYDWEMSLVKMFQRGAKGRAAPPALAGTSAATPQAVAVHSIGWFTVFDCTLGSGNRQWSPPAALTDAPIGFGYASKCLDAKASNTAYGFADVKRVLLESEVAQKEGKQHEAITRRKVCPDTLAAVVAGADATTKPLAHRRWVAPERGGAPAVRLFDGLSILKVDVEGYEFNAIPEWARGELKNLGTTSGAIDALAVGAGRGEAAQQKNLLIDFEAAIDAYFSVSLLSMEFHRSGHKYAYAANLRGAQRSHYTLLNIYSLGFLMTGQEKNHQDNCCYELVWVHYRHFVRSEVWMAVGDVL